MLETRLQYLLDQVNGWLRFAEGKNGALLAADAALIFGVLHLAVSEDLLPSAFWIGIFFGIALLAISMVLSVVSFLPRMGARTQYAGGASRVCNPLFFAHIADMQPQELVEGLADAAEGTGPDVDVLHLRYAEQIVANARITRTKLRVFAWGASLTVVGVLLLVAAVIVTLGE